MVAIKPRTPTPQREPSRAERLLENGLSDATDGIADLVAQARAVDPAADEYGHARSRAYTDAVALLKGIAKVGHVVAELRGSKFEHNINVRRQAAATSADDDGWDAVHKTGWMWVSDETVINWKTKQTFKLEKPNKDAPGAVAGSRPSPESSNRNAREGAPLPISEGSNGNFQSAAAGNLKTRSV
jgi:hypothetical protein